MTSALIYVGTDFDQLTAMTDLYLDANLSLGVVPATVLRMSHVKVFGFNR